MVKTALQRAINAVWYATHRRPDGGAAQPPALSVYDLPKGAYQGQTSPDPFQVSLYDGGKFGGGFGPTQLLRVDYWTLRARSAQLFNENLYAKGLIRRLITNEINIGIFPEAAPDEQVLGLAEDSLADWSETVENRFGLWSRSPLVCDWLQESTFATLQATARREALIEGDVLVVLKHTARSYAPSVQLVSGRRVRTPLGIAPRIRAGHEIKHGVEFDARGRKVAFWVTQNDGKSIRVPAYGEKSGRKIAWLVYGTDKRMEEVRGQPLLSIVLQSLKEIDRYRDSTQRKAVINSILAMFVQKEQDKPGTLPLTGIGLGRQAVDVTDSTTEGTPRRFNLTSMVPGFVAEELQTGEKPVLLGGEGTDMNFGAFEKAIIAAVAWANELPPEILCLAFSNNYSASQAAINEFKIYLNKFWGDWGQGFCAPIYEDWLLSSAMAGTIPASDLLIAWRDRAQYERYAAWTCTEWYGTIKISTDVVKQAKGSQLLLSMGLTTRAREARMTTGGKFSKMVKRLKQENQQLAEANAPLGVGAQEGPGESEIGERLDDIAEALQNAGRD